MLRYQVFAAYLVLFASVWFGLLTKRDDLQFGEHGDLALRLLPLLALILLGVYLLARLVVGVLSFQDCPEASKEIEMQIKEATAELKRRKLIS